MVLHSQQQRRGGSGAFMSSRRRGGRNRRFVLLVAAVAVGGFLAWRFLGGGGDGSEQADAEQPPPVEGQSTADGADGADPVSGDFAGLRLTEPEPDAAPTTQQPRPSRPEPEEPAADRPPNAPVPPNRLRPDAVTALPDESAPAGARHDSGEADQPSSDIRSDPQVARLVESGREMIEDGKLVQGRDLLNTALSSGLPPREARVLRRELTEINDVLVFSPRIIADDPYTETYVVQSNDRLQRIAAGYDVPWQFIARINNNLEPRRLQLGQRLKVVKGPFHAVVHKNDFRIDVYLGDMYVRSFDVGLGEHGSTPVGKFVVRTESKLANPAWTNPRTGEHFVPDDPENPLGGYWIGLRGTGPTTQGLEGYGIHGTIEPETIGTESSMGCVRLADGDIELVYEMLLEDKSRVSIVDH